MSQIEYFLEFPYGTQNHVPLTHTIPLLVLWAGAVMVVPSFYDVEFADMNSGPGTLFPKLTEKKSEINFIKDEVVLDYSSVFTSANADQRTIDWAKIIAKKKSKNDQVIDALFVYDFKVTRFLRMSGVSSSVGGKSAWQHLITMQAGRVV